MSHKYNVYSVRGEERGGEGMGRALRLWPYDTPTPLLHHPSDDDDDDDDE